MAKLVRCVLLHWITVSLVLSSVLCSPSVDHAPFPILRVCSQATLHCVSSFTKTFTMLQIYNVHIHLRISKVPEYTARVGIIFAKSLKCLNKVKSVPCNSNSHKHVCIYIHTIRCQHQFGEANETNTEHDTVSYIPIWSSSPLGPLRVLVSLRTVFPPGWILLMTWAQECSH